MLRSMYAGISGMKNFQTKLDSIGNNIANVNTVGYKKGRVTFQDMMSQTISSAQGPNDGVRGGINAKQVGVGSQLGSIDTIHTQGFRQTTDNPLDLMLQGDGMFIVSKTGGTDSEDLAYTRAGNFYLDNDGRVVTADGNYLMGFDVDADGKVTDATKLDYITIPLEENAGDEKSRAISLNIQQDGTVTYIDEDNKQQVAGKIALAMFSNPGGLEKAGGNLYLNTDNAGLSDNYFEPESEAATIVSGALEMSNVDLAEEFTDMITAQRGFQANTRMITTSDEILQELVNLKR
ncbi:flagellar basal body rod protein FlgG [Virgibacillus soli]|uniref:flagellar basal body rod protein FlgG n=1 Tax=Paracerasibacillus soli TaxID=480284 RepID=UPI0035E687E1